MVLVLRSVRATTAREFPRMTRTFLWRLISPLKSCLFNWGHMKLSRKSDYALRALFGLVANVGKPPVSIRELAETHDVPKRFLEQIMLELKGRGWVRSVAGRDGGFVLADGRMKSRWETVVRHFDGVLARRSPACRLRTTSRAAGTRLPIPTRAARHS